MPDSDVLSAQDWGSLNKYKVANSKLGPPTENENRIVFFGNSITESWAVKSPEFFKDNLSHICRGISGQTTPQMLIRFRADVVELQAKKVVILAGINDIAENTGPMSIEQTAGNIFSMAEIAKANGIEVVLCSVLPASYFPWHEEMEPAQKVIGLNLIIKAYAGKNALRYVDYYSKMVDDNGGLQEALTYDGVHPNEEGYAVMEKVFLKD
ncbi:MAG: lysophospholipase L1-like esterase [Polaribacter sp.]|jgi:lysophospholipase L1-like esterase